MLTNGSVACWIYFTSKVKCIGGCKIGIGGGHRKNDGIVTLHRTTDQAISSQSSGRQSTIIAQLSRAQMAFCLHLLTIEIEIYIL